MPLMREWTEITVDEDLLVPVVRELLDMAVNPNHVEVVHGTSGRTILVERHLAEHWYQERLRRDEKVPEEDSQVFTQAEVVAPAEEIPAPPPAPKPLESSIVAPAAKTPTSFTPPAPVRRAPAPKPSASPNSEDS
jgi:hypothetical protein